MDDTRNRANEGGPFVVSSSLLDVVLVDGVQAVLEREAWQSS